MVKAGKLSYTGSMTHRLDIYLVNNGMARSRARARELVEAGHVQVNGTVPKKASFVVEDGAEVVLLQEDHPYVSRGAFKLLALLEAAPKLALKGKDVLDLGASTGGFTQVALEKGAGLVYALDVGTGQLDASLARLKQVINLEKTDARDLDGVDFDPAPTVLVGDISFISLTKVLPSVFGRLPELRQLGLLVKPQFELQPEDIGSGGLVKDPEKHTRACESVKACVEAHGFSVRVLVPCPLKGGDGNQEFLLYAEKSA
ncbi:MAG: TlyA family rRNA (cytidine-2'-O)-methyltransferase [Proteobacteria bacterium]|nr:TlyA family rRNA (cytidine-2'-O)-methyltransferase [Pseudomonadota bacterium]